MLIGKPPAFVVQESDGSVPRTQTVMWCNPADRPRK
jgi:hypothetical protein